MGFDASKEIARARLQAEIDAEQRGEQRTVEAIATWLEDAARRSDPHPNAAAFANLALRIRTREWKASS